MVDASAQGPARGAKVSGAPPAGGWTVFLLCMAAFASHMGPFIYLPALPQIATEFGASTVATQMTLTLFLVGMCIGLVVYGPLSDRFGDVTMLLIGAGLFSIASLGCALSYDLASLSAARLFQGIGTVAGMVTARSAIPVLYPREQAMRLMGVLSATMALSPAIGPLFGSVIQTLVDWRESFIVLAVMVAGSSALAAVMVHRAGRAPAPSAGALANMRRLLRAPDFRTGLGLVSVTNGAFMVFMAMAPFAFVERAGLGPLPFSLGLAGCLLLYAASAIVSGRRAGRLGPRRTALVGLPITLMGVCCLVAVGALEASPWFAFVAIALIFVGMGAFVPPGHMTMLAPFPDITGTAASMGLLTMTLSGALAVAVVGWLAPAAILTIAIAFAVSWLASVRLVLSLPRVL